MKPNLIDMKRSAPDEEAGEDAMPASMNGEQYPYGLCMQLSEEDMAKLGLTGLPTVGTEVHGMFVAQVTSASQDAGDDQDRRIAIQITMLQLEVEAPHAGEEKETTKTENMEFTGTFKPAKRPAVIVD